MAKDVIQVNGEDRVVREDTAKAYRGVNWAWLSIGGFVLIMALVVAFFLLIRPAVRNNPTSDSPRQGSYTQ